MARYATLLAAALLTIFGWAQSQPLTQKDLCSRFMPSVVRIDTAADTVATGFIVSEDGWIVTVAHILFDENGKRILTIPVHMPDGSTVLPKVFFDKDSIARDFAILKVEKTGLKPLEIGSESEASVGSDISIIGYPFSAGTEEKVLPTKFCLAGIVAATDIVTNNGVKVDVIYFQGPAVKGLSGSPIISRDTGHVVGIQTAKLAGIGPSLDKDRKTLINGPSPAGSASFKMNGVDIGPDLIAIINTLDRHLANGLGAATGIDDPKYALGKAQHGKSHPQ